MITIADFDPEMMLEDLAWEFHMKYLDDHFADRSINCGWYQDGYEIGSKVYGEEPMVVATSISTLVTSEEPLYG